MRKNEVEFRITGKDESSAAFKSVTGSLKAVGTAAAASLAAFTAAATAVAGPLLKISKDTAAAQDKVQKLSDRLGIAVGALSEFHYHADLSGVSVQTMDLALQRMSRRVAEAAQGTGEARGAIRELGLNAKQLAALPLDQQMLVFADALGGLESQSDKTRLAFKLFDSGGVALLQTMKDGSQGFRDSAADLARFGAVMDEQATANSAKFRDEWTRVGTAVSGVTKGITDETIPIFSGLFKVVSDAIAENREGIVDFVKGVITGFVKIGLVLNQIGSRIGEVLFNIFNVDGLVGTLRNIQQAALNTFNNIFEFGRQIFPLLGTVLITSFRAGWEAFSTLGRGALDHVFDFLTGNNIAKPFGEIVRDAVQAAMREIDGMRPAMDRIKEIVIDAAVGTGEAVQSMLGVNLSTIDAQTQQLIDGIKLFGEVSAEVAETSTQSAMSMADAFAARLASFSDEAKTFSEDFGAALAEITMSTIDSVGQGIADIIVDGKSAVEVFKNIAKTVLKQLISTYISMKLQRLLFAKTDAAASIGLTGANTMASMSLAPFPINLTAPVVAAEHMGIASGFAATALAGVFHGGMDYVPAEASYLLNKGERVLSPRQNEDLTRFIDSGSQVGDVTVNVFTTATRFDQISEADVREFVAGRVIPAMDRLDRQGIRPAAIERAIT